MKITKSQLKKIIKEELEHALKQEGILGRMKTGLGKMTGGYSNVTEVPDMFEQSVGLAITIAKAFEDADKEGEWRVEDFPIERFADLRDRLEEIGAFEWRSGATPLNSVFEYMTNPDDLFTYGASETLADLAKKFRSAYTAYAHIVHGYETKKQSGRSSKGAVEPAVAEVVLKSLQKVNQFFYSAMKHSNVDVDALKSAHAVMNKLKDQRAKEIAVIKHSACSIRDVIIENLKRGHQHTENKRERAIGQLSDKCRVDDYTASIIYDLGAAYGKLKGVSDSWKKYSAAAEKFNAAISQR